MDSAGSAGVETLEQEVRARIDSLSYLPTTVAVAMKFIELGRDPQVDPAEYAKVISADSSLSAKLLALANSSWFGVRNKVTTVKTAVNLLGLGTVRTLAISYCMTGLHNELGLSTDESRMFWEAALCKSVAARHYASLHDKSLGDEGFVVGMFQDLAITILYATAKEPLLGILQDPANDSQMQLEKERQVFGLDHAEVGRIVAQKLELPDSLVDAIAFHHTYTNLTEFIEEQTVGDAAHVASLFPHLLRVWNRRNAGDLCEFLDQHATGQGADSAAFLAAVQEQFDELYGFFENGAEPAIRLGQLMETAAREAADNTTSLVTTVQQLMQQAAAAGMAVSQLVDQKNELEDKATRDPLTGVLNRDGFSVHAGELLAKAIRYGAPFAVVYLDLDRFKELNDTLGHEFGDRALKKAADHIQESVRQHDVLARLGGDEFALFFYDCPDDEARRRAEQIVSSVAAEPTRRGKRATSVSLSAGCLCARSSGRNCTLESLVTAADKLMYKAKQAGGNQVQSRSLRI